jgi:hypothetical protein
MLGTTDAGGRLSADLSALDQLSAERLPRDYRARAAMSPYGRWGGYENSTNPIAESQKYQSLPGRFFELAGELWSNHLKSLQYGPWGREGGVQT